MELTRNYDRTSNEDSRGKMADDTDFGPRKTLLILAIVGACFAVLWPKIFYPMFVGPSNSINVATDGSAPIRQERSLPPHAGGLHPAMRERGRAIPTSHIVPRVEGRPDHVVTQKMRPPMGGPGRVVPPQGGGGGTMGIIMPLYTIGILLFFVYTIAKILRKNSNNEIYPEYVRGEAEREFRDRVFNPEVLSSAITGVSYYRQGRSQSPAKRLPTVEELRQQDGAPKSNGPAGVVPRLKGECLDKSCCGIDHNIDEELDDSSPTVKVMGMEMTASCEGGQRISRPTTPIIPPHSQSNTEREKTPPKPIYLEGALPSQCELLVTDSETQAENIEEDTEAAVVLSGKMTLSLISLDQIPASSEETNGNIDDDNQEIRKVVPENPEDVFIKLNGDDEVVQEQNEAEIHANSENDDDEEEEEVSESEDEIEEEENNENSEEEEEVDADISEESDEDEKMTDEKNIQVKVVEVAQAKNNKNIEEEDEDDDEEEDEEEEEEEEEEEGEEEEEEVEGNDVEENSDEESPKPRQKINKT